MRADDSIVVKRTGLSRRQVLRAGAIVSAAVAVPAFPSVAGAATLLPRYRRSSYLAIANRTFYVRRPGAVYWSRMRLTHVTDLPSAATVSSLRGHQHAFALRFEGPAGRRQQTFQIRHYRFGTFSMFLAPRGVPLNGRQRYEAIIDRSHRPTREYPAPT